MTNHSLSTRFLFVLVSISTLLLIFGSAALQRIVFRAEQADSAVFLTPRVAYTKPNDTITYQLRSTIDGTALVPAAQFTFNYDPTSLEVVEAKTTNQWQSKKFVTKDKRIAWALVPAENIGVTAEISGLVEFGSLKFRALKEGEAKVSLVLDETVMSAVDASQSPSFYNAATSVQDAVLTVSNDIKLPVASTEPVPIPLPPEVTDYNTQRLITVDELIASDSALLLIRSQFPTAAVVDFGTSPTALINRLEGSEQESTDTILRLNGLEANQRYFYRVSLLDKATSSQTTGMLRSLTTRASVDSATNYRLELRLFPATHQNQTIAYVLVTDQDGAVVSNTKPAFKVTSGQAAISVVSGSGIYQAVIRSSLPSLQTVEVESRIGEATASGKVTFDPNQQTRVQAKPASGIVPFEQNTKVFLMILLGGLLVLVLVFIKLARVK